MRIIGVDPGLASTGVGIIEPRRPGDEPGAEFRLVHSENIKPPSRADLPLRLLFIHERLVDLIRRFDCRTMAVEDQFYGPNAQTALKIGQARGAALLAAAACGLPVVLYPPARVKLAVVGNGQASKEQVRHLVEQILNATTLPPGMDCSDALAVALCHAFAASAPPL